MSPLKWGLLLKALFQKEELGIELLNLLTKKSRDIGVQLFIFLVPIFIILGQSDQRVIQERFFQAASMVLFSLFFGNIWITLFFILNFAMFIVGGASIGSTQVLSIFMFGIIFMVSRAYFKDRSVKEVIVTPLKYTLALSLIFMVLQGFHIDPISLPIHGTEVITNESYNLMSGLFFGEAFSGMFIVIVASLLTFFTPWIGVLLIIPAVLSRSCAVMLAYPFLIAFFFYYRLRKWFIPCVIAMSLLGVGYMIHDERKDNLTFYSRFEHWHLVFQKFCEKPFGYGPDSFRNTNNLKNFMFYSDEDYNPGLVIIDGTQGKFQYHSADRGKWVTRFNGRKPLRPTAWQEAHNEYFQIIFEVGVLVFLIMIGFFNDVWKRFRLADKNNEVLGLFACLVVYAILSTTQFPFHLARISGIFGIILGAYYAKTDKAIDA